MKMTSFLIYSLAASSVCCCGVLDLIPGTTDSSGAPVISKPVVDLFRGDGVSVLLRELGGCSLPFSYPS